MRRRARPEVLALFRSGRLSQADLMYVRGLRPDRAGRRGHAREEVVLEEEVVKIIKNGKVKPRTLTLECHVCGCVIEVEPEELTYDDRPCSVGYLLCPTEGCKAHVNKRHEPVNFGVNGRDGS